MQREKSVTPANFEQNRLLKDQLNASHSVVSEKNNCEKTESIPNVRLQVIPICGEKTKYRPVSTHSSFIMFKKDGKKTLLNFKLPVQTKRTKTIKRDVREKKKQNTDFPNWRLENSALDDGKPTSSLKNIQT